MILLGNLGGPKLPPGVLPDREPLQHAGSLVPLQTQQVPPQQASFPQVGVNILDEDDDGDGTPDSEDEFPLNWWEDADFDGDGVGDNSDTFPSIARYQTGNELFMDIILVGFAIFMVVSLIGGYRFGGSREGKDP